MDGRHIAGYILILLIVGSLAGVWFFLSRERRAEQRFYRRDRRERRAIRQADQAALAASE